MDTEDACLVITGTQLTLIEETYQSLQEFVPVKASSFSQFTFNDEPAPHNMAYVMSNLDTKHLYNIASLKTKGCQFLVILAQHLTVPSLCELVRLKVDDVILLPCYQRDCIRLQDILLTHFGQQLDNSAENMTRKSEVHCSMQNSINFKEIVELIEQHYCAKLSLSRVAHELNLSPSRISHLFKDICGLCFRQYLTCRRLEEAETLLSTPKSNITSVGFSLGFSNPSHFCRSFKEQLGITPKAYMEGCREFTLNNVYERYQNLRLNIMPSINTVARQQIPATRIQLRSVV